MSHHSSIPSENNSSQETNKDAFSSPYYFREEGTPNMNLTGWDGKIIDSIIAHNKKIDQIRSNSNDKK